MSYCTCYNNPCTCSTTACYPSQWDTASIIYHKSNGEISELINLDLENGSTLELILETIDTKLAGITGIMSTTLTYLRTKYTVNTLAQFMVAVSTELGVLNGKILGGNQWTTSSRPVSPVEGDQGFNLTTHHPEYYNGSSWVQI